jgi:FKBP-type peptidyl-prolyl cis-trans isomerase SlyD
MNVVADVWVTVQYRLFDAQGEALEPGERTLTYLHGGYGAVLQAIEKALEGRSLGEQVTVRLEPDEAFGDYDAQHVHLVSRQLLPEQIEEGMTFEGLPGEPDDGMLYTVTDVTDEVAVLDGNHPLAGLALRYELELLDLREATDEEIAEERERAGGTQGSASLH